MLTPDQLHPYQQVAVTHQSSQPHSMLWLEPGLGKTAVTLTSIAQLLSCGFLNSILILAPIRVCRLVWRQEAVKWEHTKHLTFSMVMGTKDQRTRALLRPANIFLCNYDNLGWLAETLHTYFISKGKPLPFDGIVYDEITKTKNSTTNRVKSLRKILPHFKWRTGLTGTPASNGYKDLHGQYLVVDSGERLGTSKTAFRTRYYRKEGPYKEVPYSDTEDTIKHLIGDITIEMSAADYLDMPDLIINDVMVDLTDDLRSMYDQMERDFFIRLDSGSEVEMFNAASLTNKCLAEDTEVLTYDGWKYIDTLTQNDLVWDGVEWVNISGIVYNGYVPVIDCWGVTMTPDHKVLTDNGWKEAQEINNEQPSKRLNRTKVRTPYCNYEGGEQDNKWDICSGVVASSMYLREGVSFTKSKPEKQSSYKSEIVWVQTRGNNCYSQYDKNPPMDNMEKHEVTVQLSIRQRLDKLWGSWYQGMSRLGRIVREVLGGYVIRVSRPSNHRAQRCEQGLQQRELSMGNTTATREQYTTQCSHSDTNWKNNSCPSCPKVQLKTNYDLQTHQTWVGRERLNYAHVYDVINAGTRHRFTVRGKNKEVFIVHNCLQFSNGAMYPIAGMPMWEPIHDLKLDALDDIIEECNGQPVICVYAYRSDAERIMTRFASLRPINLTECKSESSLNNAMSRWQSGDCPLMIFHPASSGHGLDGLQKVGSTIVWYGLNWSLDLYDQANARLHRQGQGKPVICHRIMTIDTLDQAQAEALNDKANTQESLKKAINSYRKRKENH